MKKARLEKGITLIALIITIVILLVLAAVTIASINESKIIEYAQEAATDYNQAKLKEEGLLSEYEEKINEYLNGENKEKVEWTDNGNGTFSSSTGVTVGIGDYVDYKPGSQSYKFDSESGLESDEENVRIGIGTEFVVLDDAKRDQYIKI